MKLRHVFVQKGDPSKQGLKLGFPTWVCRLIMVQKGDPSKQGLKPLLNLRSLRPRSGPKR